MAVNKKAFYLKVFSCKQKLFIFNFFFWALVNLDVKVEERDEKSVIEFYKKEAGRTSFASKIRRRIREIKSNTSFEKAKWIRWKGNLVK